VATEAPAGVRGAARGLLAAVLISLVLALLALAHLYLARRLVLEPGLPEPWRTVLCGAIAVLGIGMLAQPILERFLPPERIRLAAWPPLVWMGVFFLSFCLLVFSDGLLWLLGAGFGPDAGADPRAWARLQAGCVATLTAVAVAVGLPAALRVPVVKRVQVPLARWPAALDGFRIVQITDIHIGPILARGFAGRLTEAVNALQPDLIAVTGDLVDGRVEHLREEVTPFGELRAPHGVFFVCGNHDFYSGAGGWVERVIELGIRPLRNTRVAIERDGGVFDLAGVDDYRGDWRLGSTQDLPAALAGRDSDRPVVLLAHDPSTFHEAAAAGVDLQLSGHTHGGQIWPFRWLVRLAVRWVEGLHRVGASTLYVSRGTGFWGPPIRLLAPAEITELVLRSAEEGTPA
jgi:predicted MPP superfamily phosphohydrolase